MLRLGRLAAEGLLTQEWVDEVPGELCIGLPARAPLNAPRTMSLSQRLAYP